MIQIRSHDVQIATIKDIPVWMALVDRVKDNFPGLEEESYRATLEKNIARKTALCCKVDGAMAGILLFSPKHSQLSCMAVHPDYRRQGIATRLMDKMVELMPDRDITVTTFREGDPSGVAPRKLYQQYGFQAGELIYEFNYPVQLFILKRK